jgi:uncharacterized protein
VALVDGGMKELVESGDDAAIDEGVLSLLHGLGVYIDDSINEKSLLTYKRDQFKYQTAGLNVVLVPTYACNLACEYCQVDKVSWRTMDDTIRNKVTRCIQKQISRYNYKALEINVYGGEPFVAFSNWMKMVEELHTFCLERGVKFRIGIYTNGTILKEAQIEQLLRYHIKSIQVSVDGPQAIHDKRRPYRKTGQGSYEIVMETLARLKQADLNPIVAINIDKENYEHLGELLEDLKARGLGNLPVVFGSISVKTDACGSYQSCYTDGAVIQLFPRVWQLAKEHGFEQNFTPLSFPIYCGHQTFSNMVIDAAGDLYKCYAFVGLAEHRCGTINDEGEIQYEAPYYQWMTRDPLAMASCPQCKLLPFCGGGCGAQAFWDQGTYQAPACQHIGALLARRLKAYARTTPITSSSYQGESYVKVIRRVDDAAALDIHPCGCEKRQPQPIQYQF